MILALKWFQKFVSKTAFFALKRRKSCNCNEIIVIVVWGACDKMHSMGGLWR